MVDASLGTDFDTYMAVNSVTSEAIYNIADATASGFIPNDQNTLGNQYIYLAIAKDSPEFNKIRETFEDLAPTAGRDLSIEAKFEDGAQNTTDKITKIQATVQTTA